MRSDRMARRFEIPILVAALLVVPAIAIEEAHAGEPWRTFGLALNWVIWAAFALELVVLLAVVPDRWRWLRSHPLEVVIVVFTPPFLPASLQSLRILRLLRLIRLLPVIRVARRLFTLEGLRFAALITALTALGGGARTPGGGAENPAAGDVAPGGRVLASRRYNGRALALVAELVDAQG